MVDTSYCAAYWTIKNTRSLRTRRQPASSPNLALLVTDENPKREIIIDNKNDF